MSYRDDVLRIDVFHADYAAHNCIRKAAEIAARADAEIAELRRDAERYRWLRDPSRSMNRLTQLINDDCQPPYLELKCGNSLDAAIDAARGGE